MHVLITAINPEKSAGQCMPVIREMPVNTCPYNRYVKCLTMCADARSESETYCQTSRDKAGKSLIYIRSLRFAFCL